VNRADVEGSARDVNRFSRLREIRIMFTQGAWYEAFGHKLVDTEPKP
jgi:hypothetical protein